MCWETSSEELASVRGDLEVAMCVEECCLRLSNPDSMLSIIRRLYVLQVYESLFWP